MARWYLAQVRQLGSKIDEKLPTKQQAEQAWDLLSLLRSGTHAALRDDKLISLFNERYPFSRFTDLVKAESHDYSKVLKRLLDVESACFTGETMVWTDKGLVCIKDIKVGDLVLSKHESGEGDQAYKPVTRVFVHEDQFIKQLAYWNLDAINHIHATLNHPLWVRGKGWIPLGQIESGDMLVVQSGEEDSGYVVEINDIFRSRNHPEVGWSYSPYEESSRYFFGTEAQGARDGRFDGFLDEDYVRDGSWHDRRFKTRVYNLEVEDFHTYYVDHEGVWVHNKNTGKIKTFSGGREVKEDVPVY